MRIHHLNCGCMCPVGGALFDGFSKGLTASLVCHCLLIETDDHGLVLVDTGFGTSDVIHPQRRLSRFFTVFNNIQFEERYTALAQVRQLGFAAEDVRHIVLAHLDFDHAGGLSDFPQAVVHVMQREIDAARSAGGFIGSRRYRGRQWAHGVNWQFYQAAGQPWHGFDAVRDLVGLPPEILLIPLAGHTQGHAGIAIETGGSWLLHAGDAYFYRGEIGQRERSCTPGLRFYQTMMEADRRQRLENQRRLRDLSVDHRGQVRIFCSHDAVELDQLRADGTSGQG